MAQPYRMYGYTYLPKSTRRQYDEGVSMYDPWLRQRTIYPLPEGYSNSELLDSALDLGKALYTPLHLADASMRIAQRAYRGVSHWWKNSYWNKNAAPEPKIYSDRVYKKNYLPWGNYISPRRYNGVSKRKTYRKKAAYRKRKTYRRKKY